MTPLLEISKMHAGYGALKVLHGIDLIVPEGSITALLGANGAGKTTTLRTICQMVPTRNAVRFAGRPVDGLATEKIVRLGLAHVPDGRGTLLELTVEENLRLGAYVRTDKHGVAHDIDATYALFRRLRERRGQQAGTLSGGEQQMLAIGRALMSRPRMLLLDEPSFGLAPLVVRDIFAILQRINEERKVSILLVEQNAALALNVADRAYVLEQGRVVLSGPSSELREHADVRRAYLGHQLD